MLIRYALPSGFAICLIVMSWIFFSSISANAIAAPADSTGSQNYLKRQVPRDNDASYRLPTYIPTHSKSVPRKKIDFNSGVDNDALYYAPVDIPTDVPDTRAAKQVIPPRPAPAQTVQPQYQPRIQQQVAPPNAPLQPQPRQPRAPVYVPQYQQPQYQAPPRSIYVPPTQQRQEAPSEEYYPLYYY